MKYASTLLAVLLVTGLFGVPALFADSGGDYSEPRLWKMTPSYWLTPAAIWAVSRWTNG